MLLCAGCGGVGKTTTSAALGLAAARRGKRVLCLTIDPARRLAESLGLASVATEAQVVMPEVFERAGLDVTGSLTVMMLDTKTTFDSLVDSLAKSAEKRDRIKGNVLYKYISTKLAGTQEYMAMEKLYAVKEDPNYDVILLDTPPTSHALDFLDAPERLVDAIDSPAVRWFLDAFQQSGRLSLNLLQRTASSVLRGIGRITGGGFLEQVATFMTEINELFGGWKQRAQVVASALRGDDVAYVLVTSPDPMSLREVRFFAERLASQGVRPAAYVVNRIHHVPDANTPPATRDDVAAVLARHGLDLGGDGPERILEAARMERRLGELDQLHLAALDGASDTKTPVLHVPDFPRDIHDVGRLAWVADVLVGPTPGAS
ncbi:MAG: ArsA family ATPase [Deltaproteobacteria bacterium]|nr:ArsA family ATPase [Deltaproteobacteria bacterium]